MNKHQKKAFTFVELIIVITIITILTTIWVMSFMWYMKDANDTKRTTDIQTIKIHLDNYRRNHSYLYPTIEWSWTQIVSWVETMANQSFFSEALAWKIWMPKVPLDPITKKPYLYSISSDRLTYQLSATLEKKEDLVSYNDNFSNKAYADEWLIAYVEWNFITRNKNLLPGLLYSLKTWEQSIFDIEQNDVDWKPNKAKVILNWQSFNLAYDMNWNNIAMWTNLDDVFARTSVVENSSLATSYKSCTWVINTNKLYYNWENDIFYMSWTSLNSQIWWKYKTCSWDTWEMKPSSDFYYNCANIWAWAKFDLSCHWTWCEKWYSVKTDWTPWCKTNVNAPILVYPSNSSYNNNIAWLLSWSKVAWTNIQYKVYMADALNELTNIATQTTNTYTYTNLSYSTTYKWRVDACDNWVCVESTINNFTTMVDPWTTWWSTGGWTTVTEVTDPAVKNCENWSVICTADNVLISYLWTSWNPLDWKVNDFWLSARNWNNFYWNEKTLQYKIQNNSDWRAKFKIKLSKSWDSLSFKRHANASFDDSDDDTIIDLWWEWIANNLYWKYWDWCIYNSITWRYEVIWKTTCFITLHARSDNSVPTTSATIWQFQIVNTDSLSTWATNFTTPTDLKMSASWYDMTPLTLTWASHSQQELEPSLDIRTWDFWTSTKIGALDYWYRKGLTYNVVNSDTRYSYFKVSLSWNNTTYVWALWVNQNYNFPISVFEPTIWDPDETWLFTWSKVVDIWSNWIWNVFWENDTCEPSATWIWVWKWFRLPWNSSCQITIYYRSDSLLPYHNKNIISLHLTDQSIYNKSYTTPDITLKARAEWWITDCWFSWINNFSWNCYFAQ